MFEKEAATNIDSEWDEWNSFWCVSLQMIAVFSNISRISSLSERDAKEARASRDSYNSSQQNIFPMLIFLWKYSADFHMWSCECCLFPKIYSSTEYTDLSGASHGTQWGLETGGSLFVVWRSLHSGNKGPGCFERKILRFFNSTSIHQL